MTRKQVTVSSNGKVATFTKETIQMMKEMVLERCNGLMDLPIAATGRKEFSMVKARWSFQMAVSKKELLSTMYFKVNLQIHAYL